MCVSETTSKLSATIRTFSFVFVLLRAEFVLACKYVYPIEFSFLLTSLSSQFNSHPLSIFCFCSSTFHPHGKANSLRVTEPGRLTPSFGFSARNTSTSSAEVGWDFPSSSLWYLQLRNSRTKIMYSLVLLLHSKFSISSLNNPCYRFMGSVKIHPDRVYCIMRGPMKSPVYRVSSTLFSPSLKPPMKKMMWGPTRVEHQVQPGSRLIVVGEQRCKLDSPLFRSFLRSSRPRSTVHVWVRSLVQLASHGTQSVAVIDEVHF